MSRNPESVYRAKPELPLFERSTHELAGSNSLLRSNRGGSVPDVGTVPEKVKESGLSTGSSSGAQCETGARVRRAEEHIILAPDNAHARRNDPETSRAAAASVVNLGRTRDAILSILRAYGPLTDERIAEIWENNTYKFPFLPSVSPSGLRSRRAELVRLGLVKDSGKLGKTASGRDSILWKVKK